MKKNKLIKKLKTQNSQLLKDIYILIDDHADINDNLQIIIKYRVRKQTEDLLFGGNAISNK